MRIHRLMLLLGVISLVGLSVVLLETRSVNDPSFRPSTNPSDQVLPPDDPSLLPPPREYSHPIAILTNNAKISFENVKSRQSKTLKEAVEEYRRRYKLPPPPNFDVWFEFARARGVQLTDEYDAIYHSLLPFWGLEPQVIRARAREAIGFDNALIAVLIRNGKIAKVAGGGEDQQWEREALASMMNSFVKYLPDMDLAFNIHDEPRVVIPHDDLRRLVSLGRDTALPRVLENPFLQNAWSQRPSDMNNGDRIYEFRTSRFNRFAHQSTWTNSRGSCPVDSPARDLGENAADNTTAYAFGELGFIYNTTAFSDVCLSPSLRYTFGFFDRPNALDIVHDLFPIFSQSKVSSFQDILYPSPWYWAGKVPYEADKDYPWDSKKSQMYWRGSTTGGFSRAGGWRRQHRQLFVKKINGLDSAMILKKGSGQDWHLSKVSREAHKNSFDVKFTYIGQCDPEDCKAQEEFFGVVESAGQQDAWSYKYLVDIDGNAFSGRYYAFLQSNSLIFKLAIFREWHNEWIRPWVHYVPLSLAGDEYVEALRYFSAEEEGRILGPRLARQSKEWAQKALRNDDLEIWFFRLLLEYGRVVDDKRDTIGFLIN